MGTHIEVSLRPAYQFVARFIGSLPINFIHGRLEASTHGHQFITSGFPLTLPAGIINQDWHWNRHSPPCTIVQAMLREQQGSLSAEASGTFGLLSASRARFRSVFAELAGEL